MVDIERLSALSAELCRNENSLAEAAGRLCKAEHTRLIVLNKSKCAIADQVVAAGDKEPSDTKLEREARATAAYAKACEEEASAKAAYGLLLAAVHESERSYEIAKLS